MNNPRMPSNVPDFVTSHLRQYLDTGGEEGHLWDSTGMGDHGGIPTLLLTTIGRRSGQGIVTPLIYGEAGDAYVVVASKGGAPVNPHWYLNLDANPEVEVQVMTEQFKARARTATGEERAGLWDLMVSIYPTYTELQDKTEREIPVVVLEKE